MNERAEAGLMIPQEPLFREEATTHRNRRLHGEVVLGQPVGTTVAAIAISCIVVAIMAWLSLGSFARTETVRGALVTVVPSAKVTALFPGVVSDLAFAEADTVKRGDKIAVVSVDRRVQDGRGVANETAKALGARIAVTVAQARIEETRLRREVERLSATQTAAERDVKHLSTQIALQNDIITSNSRMIAQLERVVERGFVSRHELERRRQGLLSAQQALIGLERLAEEGKAKVVQAGIEKTILAAQSSAQQNQIALSLSDLKQQEVRFLGEQSYAIIAPVDGQITALQTATGRSVMAGMTIATIVPNGSSLRAEVYAPTRAVGMVKAGQQARILFDAFPYQKFGSFGGTIVSVSKSAIEPKENGTTVESQEPVYRVTISLHDQSIQAYGQSVPLQAGMALSANLILERQSFIEWLLSPLFAVWNKTQ